MRRRKVQAVISSEITILPENRRLLFEHLQEITGNTNCLHLWELLLEEYGWECDTHPVTRQVTALFPTDRAGWDPSDWYSFLQDLTPFVVKGSSFVYEDADDGKRYRFLFTEERVLHQEGVITYRTLDDW